MTNLDSILKSRDITLPTKVRLVKAVVFPVVMYGYENWAIKKAEHQRIDAFELWCWRRHLRVLWTTRRSNQSWVSFGRTDVEAETPILNSALHIRWLICKDPDAGKDCRQEEKGTTGMRWLDGITDSMDMSLGKLMGVIDGRGGLACYGPWGRKELDMTEQLNCTTHVISEGWKYILLSP